MAPGVFRGPVAKFGKGREGGDRILDLVEQGTNLGAVVDLRSGELGREDPARVGIHADVQRL